jgi:hypothetical protein
MLTSRRRFSAMLGLLPVAGSLLGARAMAADEPPATGEWGVAIGETIISPFERRRRAEDGRTWAEGYTQGELDTAQEKYGLVFPPDLIAFYRERRPVRAWDWRTDDKEIREMLTWPLEGLLFDVENDDLWWPEWGPRPHSAKARAEVLGHVVAHAPKLIPLLSHRYLPAEPHEAGNPVFSVYQADIIYYGADVTDYFERELVEPRRPLRGHIKRIRFWSEMVDRNG